MKNHLTKLIPVLLLLVVAGCKKEEEFKTAPAVLKSIVQSPSGNSSSYTYDSQGRLTSKTNSDGSRLDVTYTGNTVYENYYKTGSILSWAKIYTVDSVTQLATTGTLLDSAGNVTGLMEFSYDGAGHRIVEQLFDTTHTLIQRKDWNYDGDGDLKSYLIDDVLDDANDNQYYYWQYYVQQTNTLTSGQAYNGKGTNRLFKTMVRFNYLLGNIRYSYTYTFDEYNRVSTEKVYDHNDVLKYTNTYTYN
jgi:YD repeat-containing protein